MAGVELRTSDSVVCRIECGKLLQQFAMRWNYIVRQRHRWSDDVAARQRQTLRLQRDLLGLGVTAKQLARLKGIVEVAVPDSDRDQYWEARILPWEYVLAAATSPHRGDESILVVRHLKTRRRKRTRHPKSFAIVETAPGDLAQHFDFSAERSLVTGSLRQLSPATDGVLENPTGNQLQQQLTLTSPDIIHVTGVDNRSGRQLLGRDPVGVRDGLYLADPSGDAQEYRAEQLASLLNSGAANPLFVGFNAWDTGARLAPMTIHAGASAAVGFQHTFDDAVAEIFFLNFYRTFLETRGNTLASFWKGWRSLSSYHRQIRGSSLILWSADSLVTGSRYDEFQRWRSRQTRQHANDSVTVSRKADPSRDRIADLMQVSVRPKAQLNYSSLHNGESVFDEFTIRIDPTAVRPGDGQPLDAEKSRVASDVISQIDDLDVEVRLYVGVDVFPFRTQLNLATDEYRYDLASDVRLPLTSELFRTVTERFQTTLLVELRWHDQTLYRHTHSIGLAPADQWTLDDRQLGWLPSFVQPRDPAVASTIDRAQTYLQCLADRVTVGFDGYQSYDGFATGLDRWSGIDRQVQSIWSALLLGTQLRYINPPPSYAEFTQRIRTPSDTVDGGFGTCIDLAILLASCLEWVEIHPVLFLLHGHVFPGYWKDLEAHRRFLDVLTDDLAPDGEARETSGDHASQRWVSGRRTYTELKGFVDRGELIPLESVALTTGKGFRTAMDEGRQHFYKKRSRAFRAMIDLVSAREGNGVTPLPIVFPDKRS